MNHIPWMQQAENDLAAAKVLSAANHHSQAVWFAEQAVEKGHKALLAALGLRYEETHYKKLGHDIGGISNLLPQELHEPSDLQVALRLATLKKRTEVCRYPSPPQSAGKPSQQQQQQQLVAPAQFFVSSQQDVADAEFLLQWCRDRIVRALRAAQAMRP
jgi:HEPN domain-containing protein